MFDRFTDRARRVMGLARLAAERLRHDSIGSEHLLLGLVEEGSGVGCAVLRELGVDPKAVRVEVERRVPSGTASDVPPQVPFTPDAKRVLERCLSEAVQLGHRYIGTEHLLLSLLQVEEGPVAESWAAFRLPLEVVRAEIARRHPPQSSEESPSDPPRSPASSGRGRRRR